MLSRVFRDLYGKKAVEKGLISPVTPDLFLSQKRNRPKMAFLVRALTKMVSHPSSTATGDLKNSGVHSVCELQNSIFSMSLR